MYNPFGALQNLRIIGSSQDTLCRNDKFPTTQKRCNQLNGILDRKLDQKCSNCRLKLSYFSLQHKICCAFLFSEFEPPSFKPRYRTYQVRRFPFEIVI
jgi:hypothetical protein